MTTSQNTSKRTWTKDEILSVLLTNDTQVAKALVKLYDYQTASEQDDQETKYHNRVGFNGVDGKFLSNVAEFYKRNGYLSPKQLFKVRKSLKKYAAQLARIANGVNEEAVDPTPYKKFSNHSRGWEHKLHLSRWSH